MYNQTEVEQIAQYVTFPISKTALLKILYDNKFSVAICNAIENASYEEFYSFKDIAYALNTYNPSII